jgi:hypothetical protein
LPSSVRGTLASEAPKASSATAADTAAAQRPNCSAAAAVEHRPAWPDATLQACATSSAQAMPKTSKPPRNQPDSMTGM